MKADPDGVNANCLDQQGIYHMKKLNLPKIHIRQWHINTFALVYTLIFSLIAAKVVFAHDAPAGDDYELADWMLFSFLIFFGATMIVFLISIKRGWMRQPEKAKYQILEIDEPDYYSYDWEREPEHKDPPVNPGHSLHGGSYDS